MVEQGTEDPRVGCSIHSQCTKFAPIGQWLDSLTLNQVIQVRILVGAQKWTSC